MAKRDFYETLGVSKTASDADLKSAFRKAAMQCHPDRHPGDKQAEARFKELNEAYQHLSDAQKRAAYDRYGHAAFDQSGMNDGFAASMSDIFDDLFGDMMGGRRGRQSSGRERGADLRYNLEITLEEAFHGKTAAIRRGKGRDLMRAQRAVAGNPDPTAVVFALVAELAKSHASRAPADTSSKLSLRSCRNSALRPAPNASRSENSRCRVAFRAISSMTTLLRAISSTSPTMLIRMRNGLPYSSSYPGKPLTSCRLRVGFFSPGGGLPSPT